MASRKKVKKATPKIRVRMYRVGMGDCFLVTIAKKHILIDCGVHAQSQFKGLDKAVAAMEKHTGGKLAVVVATHAHADHISGFGSESETFDRFDVGEVWLPWLEDLSNPAAKKLHAKTAALTAFVDAHAARLAASNQSDPLLEFVTLNALGAKGRSSTGNNAKALTTLRGGFGDTSRAKYLKAGDVLKDAGGIDGLTVRVLAPSTDTTFLSKMHPPDSQLYGLDANGLLVEDDTLAPFGSHWDSEGDLDDDYRGELTQQCAIPLRALALSVDNYLNNTSLALLLTYRGKSLLFPGDAQWGNWMSWQSDWESILGDIRFYKVGHHGSHNATPHGALDLMSADGVVAMASTDTVKTFNRGNFPVPYSKLVTEVKKRVGNRYAQSDQLDDVDAPFTATNDGTDMWCDWEV